MNSLHRRNITVAGRRTSMRLEASMWAAAEELCRREGLTMDQLCARVSRHGDESSLTSSMRVYILEYFKTRLDRLEAAAKGTQGRL